MTRKTRLLSAAGVTLFALAACDGSDGTFGNPQEQFGSAFLAAFGADETATPKAGPDLSVTFGGSTGVSSTATPVDL